MHIEGIKELRDASSTVVDKINMMQEIFTGMNKDDDHIYNFSDREFEKIEEALNIIYSKYVFLDGRVERSRK